jgi:hypothetical protein
MSSSILFDSGFNLSSIILDSYSSVIEDILTICMFRICFNKRVYKRINAYRIDMNKFIRSSMTRCSRSN